MKLCADCPTPGKCTAAGKCLKMPKKAMAKGGMAMNEGMKALKKEAPEVAKKMGYKKGGMTKKKMGYAKGGMVSCGASNPAAQKRTPKK